MTPEELTNAVQKAWDSKFSRPANDGVDYQQARTAVEVIIQALREDAIFRANIVLEDWEESPGNQFSIDEYEAQPLLEDIVDAILGPKS